MVVNIISCSKNDNCWRYGDCDPGLDCENWDTNSFESRCFGCSDGGFFTKDKLCDGICDCFSCTDEYCRNDH